MLQYQSESRLDRSIAADVKSPVSDEEEEEDVGNLYEEFRFTQHAYNRPVIPRPVLEELIMAVTGDLKARGKC